VLDDNESARLLLSRMLGEDFEVKVVARAAEALDCARATAYDVVLMDIHLSDEASGLDVMEHLRSLPGYQGVPCIAFTAFALPGDRERFLNAGFDGYLGKPFTKRQLLDALSRALGDRVVGDGALESAEAPVAKGSLAG
jgi:CheY-like chemotaxis protein